MGEESDYWLERLAELAKRGHYYCEDSWYSCPKAEDGCFDGSRGPECDCGADEHNAEVDTLMVLLRSNAELCVGGRVRLLKSIYDDGEDHHPPEWIAQAGEVLIVKEVRELSLVGAHEGNPGAFVIYPGEYETHNAVFCSAKERQVGAEE